MLFLLFNNNKKKLIKGVRQYFHCHLPLESEPIKSAEILKLFCFGVQHSRHSFIESICPTNGAVCTCKQVSPQVVSKLLFWISTDPKANTAWENGQ